MAYQRREYLNSKVKARPKKMRARVATARDFAYDSARAPVFRNGAQIHKR